MAASLRDVVRKSPGSDTSNRRLNILNKAWSSMDNAGAGCIEPGIMVQAFQAEAHPWVLSGQVSADQVRDALMNDCEVGGEIDDMITFGEFTRYFEKAYPQTSCDDATFGTIVSSLFGADEPLPPQPMSLRSHIGGDSPSPSYSQPAPPQPPTGAGNSPSLASTGITGATYLRNSAIARESVHAEQRSKGTSYSTMDLSFDGTNMDAVQGKVGTNVQAPLGKGQLNSVANERRSRAGGIMNSFTSTASEGVMPGTVDRTARLGRTRSRSPPGRRAKAPTAGYDMDAVPAGLQPIISKLKFELRARGATGIVGLSRRFRAADDDGSKTLSTTEFTKAMNEMGFSLSNKDLHLVFGHFDTDGSGTIDFEEFIQGVRDPLTARRKALVEQAFGKIDLDNNGFVDPSEIMQTYDASQHPDVISGKRTPQDVLREFLETFEVGGEIDGKVTRQEFMNYYTNIGANIPDDDYFELMIRNAWHISGGEGWCANSANRRVLVTHADGTQTVEEIQDDLGIKADDKDAMIYALGKQGIRAADISTFDGAGDKDIAPGKKKLRSKPEHVEHAAGGRSRNTVAPIHSFPLGEGDLAHSGFSNHANSSQGTSAAPGPAALGGRRKPAAILSKPSTDMGLQKLVQGFKQQLASRGVRGIHSLGKKFRTMCDPGQNVLNLRAFKTACAESGLTFDSRDLAALFRVLDDDDSGFIDFEEFLQFMRGPLNERRQSFVDIAFSKLDKDGNGVVEPAEVASMYDASMHPDVVSGKRTSEDVLSEFLETFEYGGDHDGKVTADEFTKYYTNVSASIDNDDYFELMMRNAWHISGGEGWCANTSNTRVLVTHSDGSQSVQEIKNDIGVKRSDSKTMLEHLRVQGDVGANENATLALGWSNKHEDNEPKPLSGFSTKGGNKIAIGEPPSEEANDPLNYGDGAFHRQFRGRGTSRDRSADLKSSFKLVDQESPASAAPKEEHWVNPIGHQKKKVENKALRSSLNDMIAPPPHIHGNHEYHLSSSAFSGAQGQPSAAGGGRLATSVAIKEANTATEKTVGMLKAALMRRGVRGICGLNRSFRVMDGDGDKKLNPAEFTLGLQRAGLDLNVKEARALFAYIDQDGSGGIEYEELLYTLFGELNDRRRSFVHMAFNVLDKDGSGLVEPAEIASLYDASKHPDVVSGKKSSDEVLSEFLETFEVNGDNDGKVSKKEFENYYSHVSASIDDDDYFELMMRNAWHISGGEGWCANTSNRRVLVTHSNGKQSVEEIKNDLGLKADDDDGMVGRLRKQGVDVSGIQKFGGVDTTKGKGFGPPPRAVRAAPTFQSSFTLG